MVGRWALSLFSSSLSLVAGRCLLSPSPSFPITEVFPELLSQLPRPSAHNSASETSYLPPARPECPSCGQGQVSPHSVLCLHTQGLSPLRVVQAAANFLLLSSQMFLELTSLSTKAHDLWCERASKATRVPAFTFAFAFTSSFISLPCCVKMMHGLSHVWKECESCVVSSAFLIMQVFLRAVMDVSPQLPGNSHENFV